jgi:hypothetical protein
MSSIETVENKARAFIEKKHSGTQQIFFKSVQKNGSMWLIEGEVRFKRRFFFTVKRSFRLQMRSETGEVESYKEFRALS